MSKPKLVKSSSAKAMHELANSYQLPDCDIKAILKFIEYRAAWGSYWCWAPISGSYELATQLKQALEKEGFKATVVDPVLEDGEDDLSYWVKISW